MNNLDYDDLECCHTTENREKYDASINGENKKLTLCNTCVEYFKSFKIIKILSKILEIV